MPHAEDNRLHVLTPSLIIERGIRALDYQLASSRSSKVGVPRTVGANKGNRMKLVISMVLALIGIGVLFLLTSKSQPDPDISFILKEFGMAFLIAAVLTVTVEVINSKQRQIVMADVNKSVLYAVLSRNMPEALFQEFETVVLKPRFYRRKYAAVYTIVPENGRVLLSAAHSYEAVNMSGEAADFDLKFSIDLDKTDPKTTVITSVSVDEVELSAKELKKYTTSNKTHLTFSKKIKVRKQGHITVRFQYNNPNEENEDEILCSLLPTIDLLLTVHTPSRCFDVSVETMHMADAVKAASHDGKGVHCWHMPRPLLTCQGIQFKWRKHPDGVVLTTPHVAPAGGSGIAKFG